MAEEQSNKIKGEMPEEIDIDISKKRMHIRTPNASLLLCVIIIIGLCAYIWETRLRDMDAVHAVILEEMRAHREITSRSLRAIEVIAKGVEERMDARQRGNNPP